MLVSLTVGKVDAGVAVLLTEDKRLIEFPSILLPSDISSGSMVDIEVGRNHKAETDAQKTFNELQADIFRTFGQRTPSTPVLKCRNATQTSVVLEWDPIDIATAELRSLTLFRNGSKAGTIPRPSENHSTKLSGLAVDTEYVFHLVLRTSAGTFSSEKLKIQTHKMTDLSGITVTPGHMPAALRESLQRSVERIGAKVADTVRIDTTHFVCTEGRGPAWERAVENNIPVVVPDWVIGCEREGRIVGVRGYYLNADPRLRNVGPGGSQQPLQQALQQQQSQLQPQQPSSPALSPRTEITPPTPEKISYERNTDAPPLPLKDAMSERNESTTWGPESQEEKQKHRSEDAASQSQEDREQNESNDDADGSEANSSHEKNIEAGLPARLKTGQEAAEDNDDAGSFQDVDI